MIDLDRLRAAYVKVRDELLAERTPDGHWVGELSSSALSTATAVSALALVESPMSKVQSAEGTVASTLGLGPWTLDQLIKRGVSWLVDQQNPDGGFGDTDLSHSNIATTYLVVAALHLAGVADQYQELIRRANAFIDSKGCLDGLRERYGIDKTFVVPIMTNLALAGLADWRDVDALPFELACVPQSWYRFVGMPVVSYAIPALVAIGQARFFHAPPRNPFLRFVRRLSINRSLKVLRRMQPDSGGYLEATPLTSFVVMSLASTVVQSPRSNVRSPVAAEVIRDGVRFLVRSVRPDGSWPIDTNLATWNTTLAVNALAQSEEKVVEFVSPKCLDWLLSCQHSRRHPFTGADAGGFGWTELSGAVPDADDTSGALLAIDRILNESNEDTDSMLEASRRREAGVQWLLNLQNTDGGWPTFCRGWGKLPFDRSGADLTAHALRGISTDDPVDYARSRGVEGLGPSTLDFDYDRVVNRARRYLIANQKADGSWVPLWFGNQDHPREENPVYGTAKVLLMYTELLLNTPEAQRGVDWLVTHQNSDGGWGSGVWEKARRTKDEGRSGNIDDPNSKSRIENLKSSVEETALAVEALAAWQLNWPATHALAALSRGIVWLVDRVEQNQHRQPAPIGFYFAKLWYYEKLYPLTFTVGALARSCQLFDFLAKVQTTSETRAP